MLRAIEQPLPVSSFLHPRSPALCDDCIMQSLQTAITLAPHHPPRVSWLATPPHRHTVYTNHPRALALLLSYPSGKPAPTPARSHFFSLTRRVNPHPPPRPAPCIPAALAPAASSSPYPAGRPNAAKTSHPHLPRRANRPPAPSSSSLHPPCIRCARPHPHPHPANSPTSQQVEKLASWQVGKHRLPLPLHLAHPALHPLPLLPAALAALPRLTPPLPVSRPRRPTPLAILFSYPAGKPPNRTTSSSTQHHRVSRLNPPHPVSATT